MHSLIRSLIAVLPLAFVASGAAASPRSPAGDVDFGKLSEQWIAAHPVDKAAADGGLAALLDAHYVTASIGAFEVRFPRAAVTDKQAFEDFRQVCKALLEMQAKWLDWVDAHGDDADKARADTAALIKWVGGLKPTAGVAKAPDFFSAFSGVETVKPALDHLRDSLRSGSALGFTPKGANKPQTLLISPTRQDFVELAAVMGHFDENARTLYWQQALISWTEFGWNDLQVLAIQYPPTTPRGDDLTQGISMNSREPTGLQQHIAQRGAMAMSLHCFGTTIEPAFELGIAQTLVVEIYGQNNVRSGGGGRGNETSGTTAFIPGGNPNGGALPPTNAESKWRATTGSDFFEKPLRDSQKAGGKASSKTKDDRMAFFQIESDNSGGRRTVKAPFFGLTAGGKEVPPADFMCDYMEFFRAYKTAFVHWMRESAAEKDSHAKFAKLLRTINEAGGAANFDEVVKEVYGVPISGPAAEPASLEWRFLTTLAKH